MSASLIRSSRTRLTLKALPSTTRSYALPNVDTSGDPKKETIRRVLYPSNLRSKPTPTGTWRPDVSRALQYAIPSKQAHETIERAWLLHRRYLRKERDAEAARKFECMRKAMDVLHRLDDKLYAEANRREDPRARSHEHVAAVKTMTTAQIKAAEARIPGLFPRELRIPTDTPSREGWKYEWKSAPPPSS